MEFDGNTQGTRPNTSGQLFGTGSASHLIRSAERLASSGRFRFAIEQLQVAQRLDPANRYIQAIIDRISVLQVVPELNQQSGLTPHKLTTTVGPEFPDGIRTTESDQTLSPEEVGNRVRTLTGMADRYLERGFFDLAFDSLMKAYLLDPLSPYVIASERTVLPAWEESHGQPRESSSESSQFVSNTRSPIMDKTHDGSLPPSFSQPVQDASSQQAGAEKQHKIEVLRQQKERERLDYERLLWRDASKPPRIFGEDEPTQPPQQQAPPPEAQKHHLGGIFAKLRLGKFLE